LETLNEFLRSGTIHGLPEWLQKVERSHAAVGLRFSSPYIDPELIRIAFTVPARHKQRFWRGKVVLRGAMRDLLPRDFAERPKHPQRMRESRRFCDALAELAGRFLEPGRVEARGLLEATDVARLLRRPESGVWPPEHAMRIWTLLVTELWAQLFLDAEVVGPPPPAAA
jgi:asparagine synthase (glutamine-hydrolysing)